MIGLLEAKILTVVATVLLETEADSCLVFTLPSAIKPPKNEVCS
jgi:hypothetical protein